MGWEPDVISDFPRRVELPSGDGSWQRPGWYAHVAFNRTMLADKLYFTPIFVAEETSFDRFGIDITNGAVGGSVCRVGVYNVLPDTLMPGSLRADFGTVLVDAIAETETVIAITLPRGYYWLCHITDGAPQLQCVDGTGAIMVPIQGLRRSTLTQFANDAVVQNIANQAGVAVGGLADPAPVPDDTFTATYAAPQLRVVP